MNYEYQKMSVKEILNLIERNSICELGLSECDVPYIISMHYKSEYRDHALLIKMNSKSTCKKIRYLKNDNVCVYFSERKGDKTETAIGIGSAYIEKSNDYKNYSKISIMIRKISGRKFKC